LPFWKNTLMKNKKTQHLVFLALGSNVGNKEQHITNAILALSKQLSNIVSAKLYETKPMYYEAQDIFVNTVIKGQTDLSPQELIIFVKHTEKDLGRQKRFRNGPREIDIDILFYDQLIYESPDLVIPHPRISEREFVLKPFMDIDPNFFHPVLKKTIKELFTELKNN
jgi:2-amino-4-hydroxy-6-hydroxymethyldihydropteridine diphosphokinase